MKVIEKQVILVIGSTDGIGKQTAFDLAEMGATILLHGRSREKGIKTKEELFKATKKQPSRILSCRFRFSGRGAPLGRENYCQTGAEAIVYLATSPELNGVSG